MSSPRESTSTPPRGPSPAPPAPQPTATNQLLIREVFDIFDVTRSGTISTGELCGLLSAFNIDDVPAHVVLELHAKYDLDGNGSLDLEEFTQLVVSELSENGKLEELQLGKVEILTALKVSI